MVHGSQRVVEPGETPAIAIARAQECFAAVAPTAAACGQRYCIEPLSPNQTPVVNTVEQARAIVRAANCAGLRTMLDTCSGAKSEAQPLEQVIDQHWPSGDLVHIQLNDRNLRAPGQGTDRFAPILAALARQGYAGWLAVEPFEYQPDGATTAAVAAGYLRGTLETLGLN